LIVPLQFYRLYLSHPDNPQKVVMRGSRSRTLAEFIAWYIKRYAPVLDASQDFFERLLLGGGCLVMLDGLDKVVPRTERAVVREEIEGLINSVYPGNMLIVTSRESGYQMDATFGDDFTRMNIQRMENGQIHALVENWCRQLYPTQVEQKVDELDKAIGVINSRRIDGDLPPLVSTPMMATMVISGIHSIGREKTILRMQMAMQGPNAFDPAGKA
jgi:hypothetical protein